MKTKLLKKVRKKYGYYFNQNGYPILVNHLLKQVEVINPEYCAKKAGYEVKNLSDTIEVPLNEWCWRFLKSEMLGEYGWNMTRSFYKKANMISKRPIKNKTKNENNNIN